MRKIVLLFITVLCVTGSLFAAGQKEKNLNVAVTIDPEYTFVEKVAPDADITVMVPPGASPATYEPTPRQMAALANADLYVAIGVPCEKRILEKVECPVLHLDEKVRELYPDLKIGEGRDPHIWLSVKRVKKMAQEISESLEEITGQKYDCSGFLKELDETDSAVRQLCDKAKCTSFLVFHPAFGYFADEYGLTQYALEHGGHQVGAKHLTEMTDFAKDKEIGVIFYQSTAAVKEVESFANEISARAVMLDPLSRDYSANLKKMAEAICGETRE